MMVKTVLQRKKATEYKQISIKVPVELYEQVLAFKDRLEKIDPELVFNVSAICQEALEAAIKQAEKELNGIERVKGGTGEAAAVPTNLLAIATGEVKQQQEPQEQQPGVLATGT